MGEIATIVLSMFIVGYERCHTTDAHRRMNGTKDHTFHDPRGPEKYNITSM